MSTKRKTAGGDGRFVGRAGLAFAIGLCFAWSQWCGWAVTGTLIADDGARRTVQATSSTTAADTLRNLQAERAALGTPRTKGKVEADLDLELRKTSSKYPNGDGPKAVALKGELATIERAEKLDTVLIPNALKALQGAPAVAGGDVDVAIPVGMAKRFGWIDGDEAALAQASADAHFWMIVFLVFGNAFLATFGFKYVGVTHAEIIEKRERVFLDKPMAFFPLVFLVVEAGVNAAYGFKRAGGSLLDPIADLQAAMFAGVAVMGAYLPTCWGHSEKPQERGPLVDEMDWGPKQLGYQATRAAGESFAGDVEHRPIGRSLAADQADAMRQHNAQRAEDLARQVDDFRAGRSGPHTGASNEGAAGPGHAYPVSPGANLAPTQTHSAPMTFNIGFPPAAHAAEAHPNSQSGQVPMLPAPHAAAGARGSAPGAGVDVAGPPAIETGPPVDRSDFKRRIADQLLLFKAKELEPSKGAWMSGDDMYARYVAWAGARVISKELFLMVFGEVAGIEQDEIAGVTHYLDVAVRSSHLRLIEAAG